MVLYNSVLGTFINSTFTSYNIPTLMLFRPQGICPSKDEKLSINFLKLYVSAEFRRSVYFRVVQIFLLYVVSIVLMTLRKKTDLCSVYR
jgi:hypothetical protein